MDKIFQEPFTWYLFTTSFKNHELVIGCTIHSICTTHTIQFIQNSDIRNYRYIAWFLAGAAAAAFIYLRCGKLDTYMHLRGEIGWAELFQMKSCVLLIGSDETVKVIFALASHFDPKRLLHATLGGV